MASAYMDRWYCFILVLILWLMDTDSAPRTPHPGPGSDWSAGGGAKGLAHRRDPVLEEADLMSTWSECTSMGSIIVASMPWGQPSPGNEGPDRRHRLEYELSQEPDPTRSHYPSGRPPRYQLSLPIDGWQLGLLSGFNNGQEALSSCSAG